MPLKISNSIESDPKCESLVNTAKTLQSFLNKSASSGKFSIILERQNHTPILFIHYEPDEKLANKIQPSKLTDIMRSFSDELGLLFGQTFDSRATHCWTSLAPANVKSFEEFPPSSSLKMSIDVAVERLKHKLNQAVTTDPISLAEKEKLRASKNLILAR